MYNGSIIINHRLPTMKRGSSLLTAKQNAIPIVHGAPMGFQTPYTMRIACMLLLPPPFSEPSTIDESK